MTVVSTTTEGLRRQSDVGRDGEGFRDPTERETRPRFTTGSDPKVDGSSFPSNPVRGPWWTWEAGEILPVVVDPDPFHLSTGGSVSYRVRD